jgi:DNA mismatch repair protein MutS
MVHSADFYKLYQTTYDTYTQLYGKQVCVFLQKGSFYEVYGQQDPQTGHHLNTGKEILTLMDIVIHTYLNDGPNGTTGFYGGVPVHVLDKWAERLTRLGWSVVVIDEVKNGAGKVSRREVSKVLSPGTHIASADSQKVMILASLWLDGGNGQLPPSFGVAATDLTTGQVILYQGHATGKSDIWHTDDLRHFFQVYPPRECLVFTRGCIKMPDEEGFRRALYIPTAPIHIHQANPEQQGALELPLQRETYLREMFQPRSALPLRTWLRCATDGTSLQERALVGLLRFAEDHVSSLASCLQEPHLWHPTQSLQIVNNALTQLNFLGTDQQQCVENLFVPPLTAMGKRSLTARLCSPLACSSSIQIRQTEVSWLKDSSAACQKELEGCLSLVYDVSRLHRCVIRGSLTAEIVLQLNQSYHSMIQMWQVIQDSPFIAEQDLATSAQLCLTTLAQLFDIEKAVKGQEKPDEINFLQPSVGVRMEAAAQQIANVYAQANQWLSDFRTLGGITADACYYKPTEKNMFCVHSTKSAMKTAEKTFKQLSADDKQPYEGVKWKDLTSAARMDHPALERFQDQLDAAKAQLQRAASIEIPEACIQYAAATRSFWQPIEEWITHVDLSVSMAKTAKKHGWVKPTIEESADHLPSRVSITHLRHPLIEVQARQSKYVSHDISLGYDTDGSSFGWLLYGMNASGKSSLMKAIGLATLLAQIGSYVPATAMTIRPFRRLATRILNHDNLWAGLSSFAVEMSELREILAIADHHTLVLGDELCSGTESVSGTAIVGAGIETLHKAGSRFVFATHLHDLMKLKRITSLEGLSIWHLHVEYDMINDRLVYHRNLRPGAGSTMYGLEVAKALHLPRDMIESAFAMRRELMGEVAAEEAQKSSWNSAITRRACGVCGCKTERLLEVHHLDERHEATGGRNQDGLRLNHVRNLIVVCETCHDKHHAGQLHIGPVEDTSEGPIRSITNLQSFAHVPREEEPKSKKKALFTTEQIAKIREVIATDPGLAPKLYCFRVQRLHDIPITEAQFKSLQKKGSL